MLGMRRRRLAEWRGSLDVDAAADRTRGLLQSQRPYGSVDLSPVAMLRPRHVLALVVSTVPFLIAHAQPTITFEPDAGGALPDGSIAVDDMEIRDQFLSHGVRFGYDVDLDGVIDDDGYPLLEAIGGGPTGGQLAPTEGFNSSVTGMRDTAAPGHEARLGGYFLRSSAEDRGNTLLIEYTSPVQVASGEIWDIDASQGRTEQWRVEALSRGRVIASELSPEGTDLALDSKPWSFTIRSPRGSQIEALRFVFIGTKNGQAGQRIGLAFNNFSPGGLLPNDDLELTVLPAVELRWNSEPGVAYQVQWIAGQRRWHNLGAPVMGTGGVLSMFDSHHSDDRKYRVVEN